MNQRQLTEHFKGRGPVVMVVLDGWGVGQGGEGDAISLANTPNLSRLGQTHPCTSLLTHGPFVGLPAASDIGGSEVGHMTMGAGRIMPQGPTRIQKLLESGAFFEGATFKALIHNALEGSGALHLLGLLSDGNVHSHISHFERLIEHAHAAGVRRLYVHALLDGRDVPYQSALEYVGPLEARLAEISAGDDRDYAFASGGGREVITMDRDNNWEKVRLGWAAHVLGQAPNHFATAGEAVRALRAHSPDAIDQDLPPFVITRDGAPVGAMHDGDSVVFMNFRGDRAIQFSRAMVEPGFGEFDRVRHPRVFFAGMATYDEDTNLPPNILLEPTAVESPFGKRIVELGLHQFRLAETQKYAHVTFFFNGGYREPLDSEREVYHLIPSDKVASYAGAPAMKAAEIGAKAAGLIGQGRFAFGLINFANTDMVGHTGDLAAAIQAAQAVDAALAPIIRATEAAGGLLLITADHGNADEMLSFNPKTGRREINTRHTLNPVPVHLFDPAWQGEYQLRQNSGEAPLTLANLASTCMMMLGQPAPDDMAPPLFLLD